MGVSCWIPLEEKRRKKEGCQQPLAIMVDCSRGHLGKQSTISQGWRHSDYKLRASKGQE